MTDRHERARQAAEAGADSMLEVMQPALDGMRLAARELGDRYEVGDAQQWIVVIAGDG